MYHQYRHASFATKNTREQSVVQGSITSKKLPSQRTTNVDGEAAAQSRGKASPGSMAHASVANRRIVASEQASSAGARLSLTSNTQQPKLSGFLHTVQPHLLWPGDSQILRLSSGNKLSYARLGRRRQIGQVWLHFHGTPGCRVHGPLHAWAENHRIRVISIDRPGYGHSTLHHWGMLEFIQDVEHLLDYLDIQELRV